MNGEDSLLAYITLLLVCQLAGEVTARLLGLPVPGPVVGMAILFLGLAIKGHAPEGLERVAQGFLSHLALLFVPAGVGIILYLPLVAEEWAPIAATLVGSTLLTIAATGLIMKALSRK